MARDREVAVVTRTSESRFVHRIKLLDENGRHITAESVAPYSPRKTCGSTRCHDYDAVARGSHSRMFPGDKPDPQRPPAHVWSVFDPATRMQAPLSHGFMAPRDGPLSRRAHLTVFGFATKFGAFHPGGGRLEVDSEGKRYDARLREDGKLRSASNRDYFRARWDRSGVLENDCMVCHALSPYDHAERAAQIAVMNFRWAATVGAGLGIVKGKASTAASTDAVKVRYSPGIFDAEGRAELGIGRPPDRNCLYCHRQPAKQAASWRDCLEADVHSQAGLRCVDCHRCATDHVVAGTHEMRLSCESCHAVGRLGAPVPKHAGLPRLHLRAMSCQSCHSGPRPRVMPLAFEQPTDPFWGLILRSEKPSGPTVLAPVFARDESSKIQMFARMLPMWYGRQTETGLEAVQPRGLVSIFFRNKKAISDDDGNGEPDVNTNAEIAAMLKSLKRKGGKPVHFVGGRIYFLDDTGGIKSDVHPLADPADRRLTHNVRPASLALGAGGCAECHATDSPFFLSLGPTRAMGSDGKPEGAPLFERLGKTKRDLWLGAVREQCLKPYAPRVVLLSLLAMALHYVLFGPRRFVREEPEEDVLRFSRLERLAHLALLVSFAVLALTGFSLASGAEETGGLANSALHAAGACVFVLATAVALARWLRDMVFSRLDWGWLKTMGGCLGYKGGVPAGRFNAGQKIFFWFVCLLVAVLACTGWTMKCGGPERLLPMAYTLHDLCACLMVLAVLGHLYLGTLANPGTLRSMFEGRVTRSWLRHHHPDSQPKE